jgi:hypothetical protein
MVRGLVRLRGTTRVGAAGGGEENVAGRAVLNAFAVDLQPQTERFRYAAYGRDALMERGTVSAHDHGDGVDGDDARGRQAPRPARGRGRKRGGAPRPRRTCSPRSLPRSRQRWPPPRTRVASRCCSTRTTRCPSLRRLGSSRIRKSSPRGRQRPLTAGSATIGPRVRGPGRQGSCAGEVPAARCTQPRRLPGGVP